MGAEATAGGHPFARHWVHHAMVNVAGEKMSKSLGNFTTVTDLVEHHDPRALRLLILQTHYRKTMEVNAAAMAQAEAAMDRLDALARRVTTTGIDLAAAGRDDEAIASFVAAMEDDLGTPKAMATVFDLVGKANAAMDGGDDSAATLAATAVELAGVLGLQLDAGEAEADPEIDALVARRTEARAAKDFAEADAIRDQLQAMGIEVEDTAAGPVWRRI